MIITALIVTLALHANATPGFKEAGQGCQPQKISKTAKLTFPDGRTIKVSVSDTPYAREKGLMCVTHLKQDDGMLFVFPQPQELNFWMKNTLVSLDMVWIGSDRRVTEIREKLPASRLDTPDDHVAAAGGYGLYVLELPAGAAARHKLKKGEALNFTVAIPES